MENTNFEIRSIELGKSGSDFETLSDTSTSYHFALISNPTRADEIIFYMNTISTWSFDSEDSIHFGCMIFYFPNAGSIQKLTFEILKELADDGINRINNVLKEQLIPANLPEHLKLQPLQENRDYILIKNALQSASALN